MERNTDSNNQKNAEYTIRKSAGQPIVYTITFDIRYFKDSYSTLNMHDSHLCHSNS